MKLEFSCMNISSKHPEKLAEFYRKIGVTVYSEEGYDGWMMNGDDALPYVCVWDENKWGKSNDGYVTLVLKSKDLNASYEHIKSNGIHIEPPITAVWGGVELILKDPEGNRIIILD